MIRIFLSVGLIWIGLSACGEPKPVPETGLSTLSVESLNELRFPGEVAVPRDVYKRAHEKALRNISVNNMEERMTLLENEILKEVPEE